MEDHALDSFVTALIDLDADTVRGMARGHHPGQSSAISDLLLPAHDELRRRHRIGGIDRATLSAATELLRRAVHTTGGDGVRSDAWPLVEDQASGSARVRVVVTCPAGADNLLGAEAVGEVLGASGWPVDVITDAGGQLARHLAARAALALVVSCTEEGGLPDVARAVVAAHGVGVPVVVTGQALGGDGLRALRLAADVWIPNVDGIALVLDGWRGHRIPVAPPQGFPDEYGAFMTAEAGVVAAALVSAGAGPADDAVRSLIQGIVASLGAAVLVDDSRILLDHLTLQLRQDDVGALQDLTVVGLVDAVADSVPALLDRPTRFIAEARENLSRTLLQTSHPQTPHPQTLHPQIPYGPRPPTLGPLARPLPAVPLADGPVALPGVPASPGQAFADLLLLGALACQAPVALLSVPQPDGQWSTLSYGAEDRQGLNDPLLFDVIVRRDDAVELADMSLCAEVARSPLIGPPHNLRWAYGAALRTPDGVVLGVFCVLDRWLRQLTKREQRAMLAAGRQIAVHLRNLRITPSRAGTNMAGPPAEPPTSRPARVSTSTLGPRRSSGLPDGQRLLRSHEVAVLFDVTERTVINWASAGKLPSLRTIGGHLRFRSDDVDELLAGRNVAKPPTPVS